MMRRDNLAPGEYFHLFNRGNNKQDIFYDQKDWARFLFIILYLQSPLSFNNMGRQTSHFVESRAFNISDAIKQQVLDNRFVELINFTLMPNHFHLTLLEIIEGGISKYMQKILTAYSKYFNTKYQKIGHLFQGPYKAVRVESNEQLLYLSTYIHRNPRDISGWEGKEDSFPWSSYQDYINLDRWGNLLKKGIILDQFANKADYRNYVETSHAKNHLDEILAIDSNP
jgi:putative transposase